jgi:hypothetical protein
MSTGVSFVLIGVLIAAFLVLLIGLRPPPLYSDPETNFKVKDSNAKKDE